MCRGWRRLALVLALAGLPQVAKAQGQASTTGEAEAAAPVAKLLRYSAACEERQIEALFDAHPGLDPHGTPSAFSPFHNAARGWLAAVNTGQSGIAYQNKCEAVMRLVAAHPDYDWTRVGKGGAPDIYLFLAQADDLTGQWAVDAFRNTAASLFGALKDGGGFDINHVLSGPIPEGEIKSMLDLIAAFAEPQILCDTVSAFPTANLELRRAGNDYTPLLVAIRQGNLDMVKRLIGEGADWLISVDGVTGTPAFTIARNARQPAVLDFLTRHEQRQEPGTVCPD